MHPNRELIHRFYHAFNRRDGAAVAACYATDVVFEDPAFGTGIGSRLVCHIDAQSR